MGITSRIPAIALASALSCAAVFNAQAQEAPVPQTPQQEQTEPQAPRYDMAELQALANIDPADITDQATLNANLLQLLQNMDVYYATPQTYENAPEGFDAMDSPFMEQSIERLEAYIEEGADLNYIDPQTHASTFAYALWMAYEMDNSALVEQFIDNGANVHLRVPATTAIPKAEANAYEMLFNGRPDTDNTEISILDHAALALLESQTINASDPLGVRSSVNHVRTAANITSLLLAEGAVWSDILQLPESVVTPRGEFQTDFDTVNDLVRSYAAADIFYQEGLISAEQRREYIYGSAELRDIAMNLTEINDDLLESWDAPLVDYPDVPPGGPEPYTVETGDTVWDIAGRFAPFMGENIVTQEDAFWAMADLNNMTVLPRNNVMRIDENGGTTVGITEGETLLIPVRPEIQLGFSSAPVAERAILQMLTDHIMSVTGMSTLEFNQSIAQIAEDLAAENNTTRSDLGSIMRIDSEIILPDINGESYDPVTFTIEDVMRVYSEEMSDRFYIQGADIDTIFNSLAQVNDLDNITLCEPETLAEGESCPLLWVPYLNDTYNHFEELTPPEDIDPDRRVNLFVTEMESYHQKMATRAAAGSNYAINPDVDMSQFHVLADAVWATHIPTPAFGDGSLVLDILQHPDNSLSDEIIFTSSMGSIHVDNESENSPAISQDRADIIRNLRSTDHSLYENIRSNMERMEDASPIVFQAVGNSYPGNTEYTFSLTDIHSGRTVMTGAAGNYEFRGQEHRGIAPYSSPGADICMRLPTELGRQNEGTSFSTPNMAGIYRQMSEWYGHHLSFEEIMAAGMMTAARNTPEISFGPFGVSVTETTYRTNGAGLPFNYRCGAGEAIPEAWNEALEEMVELKTELDNAGGNRTEFLDIGDADEIETLENGDTVYTYRIEVPQDLTLTRQTFLLPQEAGAHSEVMVRMPSGFEYQLPKSLTDVVSTSAFSYEDIQQGDVIEIITGQPLGETATMILRGLEDNNAIQALRDVLLDRGTLYEPHMVLTSDGTVTNDPGIDIDLTPPLPELPNAEEETTPSPSSPHP